MMRVSIIGAGYMGLVTGVGLAARGHAVTCVDVNAQIVQRLNRGEATIHERGLDAVLADVREAERFRATTNLAQAVRESEVSIITVGTPNTQGQIDLRHVRNAAMEIGRALRAESHYHTVVVKSTVLPGTTDSIVLPILEGATGKELGDFGLGANPEFLREGNALEDFMNPDRIVLGADDPRSARKLRELYSSWAVDFVEVNTRTAEMIKYVSNCLLATQISVTNEIANLATALGGIDAVEVMRGVHLDRRWNPFCSDGQRANPGILTYLFPGCGFGGSCLPKDVEALVAQGKQLGLPMWVLDSVLRTNNEQPMQVIHLLTQGLRDLRGKRIAVLGLAFKPGTDDVRQSPSLTIIRELLVRGAYVTAADPVAHQKAQEVLAPSLVSIHADWREAVQGAHAVVLVTGWDEYRTISPTELKNLMSGDVIVDARLILSDSEFAAQFRVYKIGYAPVTSHDGKQEKPRNG